MKPTSVAVSPISSTTALRERTSARWRLDVRSRAQRQLSRLPEKIATAAAEFITGALLVNPYRVGHPLHDEYAGQYSARRGADWRVRYQIAEDSHTVIVLDISHRSGYLRRLIDVHHRPRAPGKVKNRRSPLGRG